MHNKIWSIKYDELDQIDYLDIEYNKTALFKIPTKEYLEYKLKWKIDDFDERVRMFTYHKPIFKESDGKNRNIERRIIDSKDGVWCTTQYAIGEFGQTGRIDGIGFSFQINGYIIEGNCINGRPTFEIKEVNHPKDYFRHSARNGIYQGYFYKETDVFVQEGYLHNGVFKGNMKEKYPKR